MKREATLPYALAILSGILLSFSFPNSELDILAWCALMPLAWVVLSSPAIAFRLGYAAGLAFFWPSLFWLRHVTWAGWLALGAYLALYVAAWSWSLAKLRARYPDTKGSHHLMIAGLGAAAWVALEWLRAHLLSGFPWNPLGATQYRNLPLVQMAEMTGVYGVSFLIAFFNLAFLTGMRRMVAEKFAMGKWRYEITAALLLLVVAIVSGMRSYLRYSRAEPARQFRVAVVQPNVPQSLKWDEQFELQSREDLRTLTLQTGALEPDLVVWPETALTSAPAYDREAAAYLDTVVRELGTPLLAGTIDIDLEPPHVHYNGAILVRPDGTAEPAYRKRHLVPFGEFVPLEKKFPILRKLTPIQASFGRGKGAQIVALDPGVKLGVLICFEDVFPYLARDAVRDGANLLLNVTNDGWFKESDAQVQHAAAAVFRAVENRVPLARACNNGYSCIVESTGRITADIRDPERGIYIRGVTAAAVGLPTSPAPPTFYNRYGDVFAISCLAAACVVWILGFLDFLSTRKAAKAQKKHLFDRI